MDSDYTWARERWNLLLEVLPAPEAGETVEIDDSQPAGDAATEANRTDVAHQQEQARNAERAADLRREEEAILAQAMQQHPAGSLEAPATRYRVWVDRATLGGGESRRQGVAVRPGETVRLQLELKIDCNDTPQMGHQAGPVPGQPQQPLEEVVPETAGPQPVPTAPPLAAPTLLPAAAALPPADCTAPTLPHPPAQGPVVYAYSALPPTPPKCPAQRTLYAAGMKPSLGTAASSQACEPDEEREPAQANADATGTTTPDSGQTQQSRTRKRKQQVADNEAEEDTVKRMTGRNDLDQK